MAGNKLIETKENDVVEYYLYPQCEGDILEQIEAFQEHVRTLACKYIWHCDHFHINLTSLEDNPKLISLSGRVNYGENIEDEWFVVFLLLELTKKFPGLVVRVQDSDGEFLLIEAAEHLPSWITPETSENKVFLYNGHLHILPKSYKTSPTNDAAAVAYIRQHSGKTKSNTIVQQAIQARIEGYPDKIERMFHKATLYLPVGIAALLDSNPRLVAPAVRAFSERDLLDIRACSAMKYFPPENRVFTSVCFTRCLYAMLVSSKYTPDRRTGWNLPPFNDENYESHLLGIKLACGFEILLSQAKSKKEDENLNTDLNWKSFITSLINKNYFQELLEESQEYNKLLEQAKSFYNSNCKHLTRPSAGKEISSLLETLEIDVEEYKRREADVPKSDDDSWLNITQNDLESLLEARFGKQNKNKNSGNIASQLNNFLNHVSTIDGAEFPRKPLTSVPTRPKRGVKKKKKKSVKFSADTKAPVVPSDGNKVQFDPEGFMHAIQNILDFKIPDDNYWESEGSGMSSYEDEEEMELGETLKEDKNKKNVDNDMMAYMDEMDQELAATTIGESFVKKTQVKPGCSKSDDSFDDIESFEPVNIDLNALKHIISSYQSQMGEAGPAENLLGPMGVNLDDLEVDVD